MCTLMRLAHSRRGTHTHTALTCSGVGGWKCVHTHEAGTLKERHTHTALTCSSVGGWRCEYTHEAGTLRRISLVK